MIERKRSDNRAERVARGLLQTEDYARHMFLGAVESRSDEHLKRIIAVRMHRQERLISEDNPLQLAAIVDQAALHRRVGDAAVMREQFAQLVAAAALPRVTLQVIPFSAGPHPATTAGFTLLSFDGIGMPDMAYVEHPAGAVHIAKEAPVERARITFDWLRTLALSPDDSVELIERVATTMR